MKVRVVKSFVSRTPKTGKVFRAVGGQILDRSELPKGNDFMKCGLVVSVREDAEHTGNPPGDKTAERAVQLPGEKALEIEDRPSNTTKKKTKTTKKKKK